MNYTWFINALFFVEEALSFYTKRSISRLESQNS